jgi:hypothetical protein
VLVVGQLLILVPVKTQWVVLGDNAWIKDAGVILLTPLVMLQKTHGVGKAVAGVMVIVVIKVVGNLTIKVLALLQVWAVNGNGIPAKI